MRRFNPLGRTSLSDRLRDTHLHELIIGEGRFGVPDPHYRDNDLMNELGVSLRELLEEGVGEFVYLYDFGDGWVHQIDIEKTLPADPARPALYCVAGENARPLEDIGGPTHRTCAVPARHRRSATPSARGVCALECRGVRPAAV